MRREIGSEFWSVPVLTEKNNCFPNSVQWFLSGRSALQAIIKEVKGHAHTVAIPSWCCESMVIPFLKEGMEVRFYPVYLVKEGLTQEYDLSCDAILVMDYFGYSVRELPLDSYSGIIIRDVTHSFMQSRPGKGDYCFGSLRKWCGVWTGGFAWANDGHKLAITFSDDFGFASLRKNAMEKKREYILHTTDGEKKDYLELFGTAEDCLEKCGIAPAAERDIDLANRLDVEQIRERRKENADILMKAFQEMLIFPKLDDNSCPMFVPVIVPDARRDLLRQYMIQQEIYCPVHWPETQYHKLSEKELFIYRNELSLVCDQRYSENDMRRIVEVIRAFFRRVLHATGIYA